MMSPFGEPWLPARPVLISEDALAKQLLEDTLAYVNVVFPFARRA
jgi:hypothetical protein